MIKRALLGLSLALAIPAHAAPPPNIVLMLIDDLGWQELKCYDIDAPSPADTPNMDALAKRGILFRHAYSPAPSCTPSRCAIMSGNHPARAQTTCVAGGNPPEAKPNKKMITPWFRGGMPANEQTMARTLRENGYKTGHAGKWHMGAGPLDHGFDFTTYEDAPNRRGVTGRRKNRLQDFATDQPGDPYRLDAEGFPTDSVTVDALKFMETNKDKPFFLYYATWLVHTPIHCRSKALVDKYAQRLGVDPANPKQWPVGKGQKNPFFCAMVEMLDHYVGQLVTFLETTDDPRNPGHKLIDNTYILFTSDNGGVEGSKGEGISDNAPLDKGKTSPREGGVRVPFLVAGPGISAGKESDVVVNGLDFYPTILSMAGVKKPEGKNLDGANLQPLLTGAVEDSSLVLDQNGKPRTEMAWHYPHFGKNQSTIRAGDFKLIRNYETDSGKPPALELYRLVDTKDGKSARVDIEEAKNLAAEQPEKAAELNARLTEILTEMKASLPYWNPNCIFPLTNKDKAPTVTGHTVAGQTITATFQENGARVVRADAIYTTKNSGGGWFRMIGEVDNGTAKLALPPEANQAFINLIDENNFMVSYPQSAAAEPKGRGGKAKGGSDGEDDGGAAVGGAIPLAVTVMGSAPSHAQEDKREKQFNKLDADKSGTLTLAEYTSIAKGPGREANFTLRDTDKDGSLTLVEFCTPVKKISRGITR
jgi:arylsulfatase A-like enzyme